MSQPPPYNRLANFTDYALAHTSAPYNPSDHDAELNAVETTLDATLNNLALIQRDDGEVANETIGIDQLETELRALIAIGEDGVVEPWTTGHTYNPGDAVAFGVDAYLCVVTHVATTFALDLAAGYWVLIGIDAISTVANAALIAFTPVGTIASMNVQAAIEEVSTETAAAIAAVSGSGIPLAQKGAANGVATLDATVKVPVAQIPDLSAIYLSAAGAAATYIPLTQKAAPLGVATLDALGIVLSSQLPSTGGPFVPLGEKGLANGVATLDAGTKVPVAQIPDLSATYVTPAAAAAGYVAKTAATGAAGIPAGTTGQRPGAPAVGYLRWNSTTAAMEVWDGSAWTSLAPFALGVPTGTVLDWAAPAATPAPTGYLFCQGAAVSRTTFAALFAVIGTTWGPGDGSTTFNVPDLSRRVTVGPGGTGTGILGSTPGSLGGAEGVSISVAQMPAHGHVMNYSTNQGNVNMSNTTILALNCSGVSNYLREEGPSGGNINMIASAGSTAPHDNIQPSAVMWKIIKT